MNIRFTIGTLSVLVTIYSASLFNIAKTDTPLVKGVGYSYNSVSSGVTYPIDSLRFDSKNKIVFQIVMGGGVDWDGVA